MALTHRHDVKVIAKHLSTCAVLLASNMVLTFQIPRLHDCFGFRIDLVVLSAVITLYEDNNPPPVYVDFLGLQFS